MDFNTAVKIPDNDFKINLSDTILLLGSCFAENVGKHLQQRKLRCEINPFGVLYNPESIRIALTMIADGTWPDDPRLLCVENNGKRWFSWLHTTEFSADSRENCIETIVKRLMRAHTLLKEEGVLILTFGTNRRYILKETGLTVGNCHKQPAAFFDTVDDTPEAIVNTYTPLLDLLFERYPRLRVLFTISPYRYAKYGFHGNQLSKASLLLAVDALVQKFAGHCFYFPAYEIMMDELRDYRFYADDMLHPSALAVNYIWEKFSEAYFEKSALLFFKEWEPIMAALEHRPFNPDSEAYHAFVNKIVLNIERIREKYPNLVGQNEITELMNRIK